MAGMAFVGSALSLLASVQKGHEYDVTLYPAYVLCFGAALALTLRTRLTYGTTVRERVRQFADYSFTLYLTHYTLLYALTKLWPNGGWAATVVGVLVSNAVAYALARLGEAHHKTVAAWLATHLLQRPAAAALG
jgi:peptidoglycan/LPS O-acetylase OafA/YrhL